MRKCYYDSLGVVNIGIIVNYDFYFCVFFLGGRIWFMVIVVWEIGKRGKGNWFREDFMELIYKIIIDIVVNWRKEI